jgi:hypothetical protein
MTRLFLAAGLFTGLFLVACAGGETATPTPDIPQATASRFPGEESPPGPAGTAQGYPAPATATETPAGYPAAATPTAPGLPEGYPAGVDGEVWIVHAAGEQCQDALTYPDLASAEAALEAAGVTVLDSEAISLAVCQACGCPTSEQYRVRINAADVAKALALDWVLEQG